MVAVVHGFMVGFEVPSLAAWFLGAMMYVGLVAVLFARRSLLDKLGIYFVYVVTGVVGALTVCPCTGGALHPWPVRWNRGPRPYASDKATGAGRRLSRRVVTLQLRGPVSKFAMFSRF
jgi:hypothetical protein